MPTRELSVGFVAAALSVSIASSALANVLTVDDDHLDDPHAQFARIQDAIDVAGPGDEVLIAPGLYEEQLVLKDVISLEGRPVGTSRVQIRPTSLPESRPSVLSGNPIVAGILIDTTSAKLSNLDVDMSANGVTGCTPILTGIYYRNSKGSVEQVAVTGVRVDGAPQCESGVGLYVESGDYGLDFGLPAITRATLKKRPTSPTTRRQGWWPTGRAPRSGSGVARRSATG